MARKMCNYCQKRPSSSISLDAQCCEKCWDYLGWENQHNDEGHETAGNENADCPLCGGEPDPSTVEVVKGHSNGIKKSHTSHASCSHEKTKSARAKCRKERAAR